MKRIRDMIANFVGPYLKDDEREVAARAIIEKVSLHVYESSISVNDGKMFALLSSDNGKNLLVICGSDELGDENLSIMDRREIEVEHVGLVCFIVKRDHAAAVFLRHNFSWLRPTVCGLKCSAGLGDRLGLATPGHIRAVRGSNVFPFVAQQSIREMTRTQRTPQDVMDDAMWGVFQEGWRSGFGSDADHLKTPADIDNCLAAGFTMFTFDPGDHVQSAADTMDASALADAAEKLPWDDLDTTLKNYKKTYSGREVDLGEPDKLTLDEETVLRAAVKYGPAVAHAAKMYRHLEDRSAGRPFEVEVSVDETETPTTLAEHYLIAAELKRLGVQWVSLAPRFIGEFEKGIDYKGDLAAFEKEYAKHVAIAEAFGPYKLSIHSGSDKFAIYAPAAKLAEGRVHLKTAGTSYLEALRVVARKRPELFRRILDFAFERFDEDKATYHISARKENIPTQDQLGDEQLESILDGNDGRQLLHVTYGSVLTAQEDGKYVYREELMQILADNEEEHYKVLADHLGKHVRPLAAHIKE
jgi:tagaturonate epimerase